SGGTVYTAQVDALRESPADDAYPRPLYQLVDHLTSVHHQVLPTGTPYRPNAVRLLTVADARTSARDHTRMVGRDSPAANDSRCGLRAT
ncbi:MAG: hypothetical protein QOE03_3682, partial [Micromonosporaceae bacterium]|nr:hypothetical protein [Micromonosporaceae bacterium]